MGQLDALTRRFILESREDGDDEVPLSRQERRVIRILGQERTCTMGELAGQTTLSVSRLTGVVDSLVTKRLAERARADDDRRVVRVRLTAAGEGFYGRFRKRRLQMARAMLGPLSPQEQEVFLGMMLKIGRDIQGAASPRSPRRKADRA